MIPQTLHRLTLLQQFLLLSGFILLVGAGATGWWIDRQIVGEVIAASVRMGAVYADSTIAPHLWELDDVSNITPSQRAHLDQLVSNNIRSQEFVAFNVWLPSGEFIYSNPPATLNAEVSPGFEIARGGAVHTERVDRIQGHPRQSDAIYIETYFPIRSPDETDIIAVVAFYQQLSELMQSIQMVRLRSWLMVGTGTALMYILLFSLVKRGNDTIAQQQRDLARSRRHIQQAAVRAAALNEASMRRLGRDLHDGPAQDLGIALMRMEPLRTAIDDHVTAGGKSAIDLEAVSFDLDLIDTALRSSLKEVRELANGLRLPDLIDLDLAAAVRKAVTDYMRKTGRHVDVGGPKIFEGDAALKSVAYRFVQETLNNGHLHAEPNRQWVRFEDRNGALLLEVGDDGRGFDPESPAQGARRQLGLAGLQERAEILGGHLTVDTELGQGTVVHLVLPYDRDKGTPAAALS